MYADLLIYQTLSNFFLRLPLGAAYINSPGPGRSKNVFPKAAAKVSAFSLLPNPDGKKLDHFPYGVLTARGNTLPLKNLCPSKTNRAK